MYTDVALIYFFASAERYAEQSLHGYFALLARELIDRASYANETESLERLRAHLQKLENRSYARLRSLVHGVAECFKRVYIIFDGFDEFSPDPNAKALMAGALGLINHISEDSYIHGVFRTCIFSRESTAPYETFRPTWTMNCSGSPIELEQYITKRISSSYALKKWTSENVRLHDEIVAEVKSKSGQLYESHLTLCCYSLRADLCVRIKVASLQMDLILRQASLLALKEALNNLSGETDNFYTQALKRVEQNKVVGPTVKRLLGWMLILKEPLLVAQARQALAVTSDLPVTATVNDVDMDIEAVLAASEGLIQWGPKSKPRLSFAHETFFTFLQKNKHLLGDTDWSLDLARSCLQFMALKECLEALERTYRSHPPTERQAPTGTPFLDWAAYYWETHAADIDSSSLAEDLQVFARCLWTHDFGHKTSPILICCYFQWQCVAECSMRLFNFDVNATGAWTETPLHLAIARKHLGLARTLIERKDVDVNATFYYGRTALHIAASMGLAEIFELLVRHGAIDINAPDAIGLTPLDFILRLHSDQSGKSSSFSIQFIESLLRHPDLKFGSDDRGGSTLFKTALKHYETTACKCKSWLSTLRRPDCGCELLRILVQHMEEVGLGSRGRKGWLAPCMLYLGQDKAVKVLLSRIKFNMDIKAEEIVMPCLTLAIHSICFAACYSPPDQKFVEFRVGYRQCNADCIGYIIARCCRGRGDELHKLDSYGHSAMDWTEFYASFGDETKIIGLIPENRLWFERHRVNRSDLEFQSAVLRAWTEIEAHVPALRKVYAALKAAGARSSRRVERITFLTLMWDMWPHKQPDQNDDAQTASAFPSLAVERGSTSVRFRSPIGQVDERTNLISEL